LPLTGQLAVPDSRYPRIVGFEVPDLRLVADPGGEPVIAFLDGVPSPHWFAVFEQELRALTDDAHIARVSLENDRLLLFGVTGNVRQACVKVRALATRISFQQQEKLLGGKSASNDSGGAGPGGTA
jgi:hypothetical protein